MKTRTVAGANLFRIALEEYGDATQWWRIAKANGLRDPVVTGLKMLNIPPANSTDTGGILDPRVQ